MKKYFKNFIKFVFLGFILSCGGSDSEDILSTVSNSTNNSNNTTSNTSSNTSNSNNNSSNTSSNTTNSSYNYNDDKNFINDEMTRLNYHDL